MKRNDCRKPRGCVYDHHGYWYLDVRLPGETKRHKHPLCAPGSDRAMHSDRPKEMAVEAAHRIWEEATRHYRVAPTTSITVDDLCAKFIQYAEVYYRGSSEAGNCAYAVRTFCEFYGSRVVAELSQLRPLKRNRSMARETQPIHPVDDKTVEPLPRGEGAPIPVERTEDATELAVLDFGGGFGMVWREIGTRRGGEEGEWKKGD